MAALGWAFTQSLSWLKTLPRGQVWAAAGSIACNWTVPDPCSMGEDAISLQSAHAAHYEIRKHCQSTIGVQA